MADPIIVEIEVSEMVIAEVERRVIAKHQLTGKDPLRARIEDLVIAQDDLHTASAGYQDLSMPMGDRDRERKSRTEASEAKVREAARALVEELTKAVSFPERAHIASIALDDTAVQMLGPDGELPSDWMSEAARLSIERDQEEETDGAVQAATRTSAKTIVDAFAFTLAQITFNQGVERGHTTGINSVGESIIASLKSYGLK